MLKVVYSANDAMNELKHLTVTKTATPCAPNFAYNMRQYEKYLESLAVVKEYNSGVVAPEVVYLVKAFKEDLTFKDYHNIRESILNAAKAPGSLIILMTDPGSPLDLS